MDAFNRPLYYGVPFSGFPGNGVERTACQWTANNDKDPGQHHAEVGVAGSNPVVQVEKICIRPQDDAIGVLS
jgi:hypothetical protein